MRADIALVAVAGAACIAAAAHAFPDGAPWGAANPAAEQHCATCHFDAEPVRDSRMLNIKGLPAQPVAGTDYELEITFDDPEIVVAGFQVIADAADREAGVFASTDDHVECIGSAVRSTAPRKGNPAVSWKVSWRAPGGLSAPIAFLVAASAANDDGSPFGDRIHYRSYELRAQ